MLKQGWSGGLVYLKSYPIYTTTTARPPTNSSSTFTSSLPSIVWCIHSIGIPRYPFVAKRHWAFSHWIYNSVPEDLWLHAYEGGLLVWLLLFSTTWTTLYGPWYGLASLYAVRFVRHIDKHELTFHKCSWTGVNIMLLLLLPLVFLNPLQAFKFHTKRVSS